MGLKNPCGALDVLLEGKKVCGKESHIVLDPLIKQLKEELEKIEVSGGKIAAEAVSLYKAGKFDEALVLHNKLEVSNF